jgi:hypothetical protein
MANFGCGNEVEMRIQRQPRYLGSELPQHPKQGFSSTAKIITTTFPRSQHLQDSFLDP